MDFVGGIFHRFTTHPHIAAEADEGIARVEQHSRSSKGNYQNCFHHSFGYAKLASLQAEIVKIA